MFARAGARSLYARAMVRRAVRVTAATAACAAGLGKQAILDSLIAGRSGLRPNHFGRDPLPTWIGAVPDAALLPLPPELAAYECRNNRLAWLAYAQDGFSASVRAARERHGPERVALVIGTSTSSIGASEEAYRELTPEHAIPAHCSFGELTLFLDAEKRETPVWRLLIGQLPPIERLPGLQARLNLLGVHSGHPGVGETGNLEQAIAVYQHGRSDLTPSGEPDDDTRRTADDEYSALA